jgi:hypothetical protein
MDYKQVAEAITREHVRRTYGTARREENKPICYVCYVPCDPRSREYRGAGLCPACYDAPIIAQPKQLLPIKENPPCQTKS